MTRPPASLSTPPPPPVTTPPVPGIDPVEPWPRQFSLAAIGFVLVAQLATRSALPGDGRQRRYAIGASIPAVRYEEEEEESRWRGAMMDEGCK